MNHFSNCADPDVRHFLGRLGDTMAACSGCGRLEVASDDGLVKVGVPVVDRVVTRGTGLDPQDIRQVMRRGDGWPRHRARRRGRGR